MSEQNLTDPALRADLRRHARSKDLEIYVGNGWLDLVRDCHHEVAGAFPEYELLAVKEKYGALAFQAFPRAWRRPAPWTDEEHERLDEIVERYESLSTSICEACGAPGELRLRAHELTLCDGCDQKILDSRWQLPRDRR